MQKEIFEQPIVVAQTLKSYLRPLEQKVALPQMDFSFADVPRITIVACGTSFYAGMVAKYWLEQFDRVPVELDIASEFRYRAPVLEKGGMALFISQSGETAATLAALRHARACGQKVAVVVHDRKSVVEGKSVSVRVDLGGRRLINKKTATTEPTLLYSNNSKTL